MELPVEPSPLPTFIALLKTTSKRTPPPIIAINLIIPSILCCHSHRSHWTLIKILFFPHIKLENFVINP